MAITKFHESIGTGSFGVVYRATDDLKRDVAVKAVKPSAAEVSDALQHGTALARVDHPNVVRVYTMEETVLPEASEPTYAIIMEFIPGESLADQLAANQDLDSARALQIGLSIGEGLAAIHDAGVAHGDLHEGNILVSDGVCKIIDILYTDSLQVLGTTSRDERLTRDLISYRYLLRMLISATPDSPASTKAFNEHLTGNSTIKDLQDAFSSALSLSQVDRPKLAIGAFLDLMDDESFVETDEYASSLVDDIDQSHIEELCFKIIDDSLVRRKHINLVAALWRHLQSQQKLNVASNLAMMLDKTVPGGRWPNQIFVLQAIGKTGWSHLPKRSALRLEGCMADDILNGHYDIHRSRVAGGSLGTWAGRFWSNLGNKEQVATNIVTILSMNWFSQNYAAKYFGSMFPVIAAATGKRAEFVRALTSAVANDARLVVRALPTLPQDWQDEIARST